jgi:hypothetical protein
VTGWIVLQVDVIVGSDSGSDCGSDNWSTLIFQGGRIGGYPRKGGCSLLLVGARKLREL